MLENVILESPTYPNSLQGFALGFLQKPKVETSHFQSSLPLCRNMFRSFIKHMANLYDLEFFTLQVPGSLRIRSISHLIEHGDIHGILFCLQLDIDE